MTRTTSRQTAHIPLAPVATNTRLERLEARLAEFDTFHILETERIRKVIVAAREHFRKISKPQKGIK